MIIWKYKVHWHDNNEIYIEEGITCGKNIVEATQKLENYYGKNVINLSIEHASDSECGIYVLRTVKQD